MRQLPLGASGLTVPAYCLGTMTFGNQTPQDDAHRQLDLGLAHGIGFLDAAEMYPVNPVRPETMGLTEEILGNWFAARGAAVRDRVVLATKVSGKGSEAMAGGTPPITAPRLRSAVEAALVRLRTDRIDLFQLHWPNRGSYHFRQMWGYRPPQAGARAAILANMAEVLAEAGKLIAEGKIRAFGLSNESAWGLAHWLRLADAGAGPRVASVQNEYSLICRLADTDMAESLALEGVPLLAFSPLGAGLLTGKYQDGATPPGSRRSFRADLGGRFTPRALAAVESYHALARDLGLDPIMMALAWVTQRPFPCIPILGATTSAQLEAQLPALELTLPPEALDRIDALHRAHPLPY
jgi:aryl-alcohol dehydrogenase-like predicted oxidoreductase